MFKRLLHNKNIKTTKLFKSCLNNFVVFAILISSILTPTKFILADEVTPENENKVLTTINETANLVFSFFNSFFKKDPIRDNESFQLPISNRTSEVKEDYEKPIVSNPIEAKEETKPLPILVKNDSKLQPFIINTSGITEAELNQKLNILENSLKAEIYRMSSQLAPSGTITPESNFQAIALSQIIDNLDNVTIQNATITGPGSSFTGPYATITNLTSTDLNTTNLTVSGTNNFSGSTNLSNASSTRLSVSDYLWIGDQDTDSLNIRAGLWTVGSTATTTVAMTNGLNFDNNTFTIDPNSNRIGILTSTPNYALDVNGTFRTTGNTVFDSNLSFSNIAASINIGGISTTTATQFTTSGNYLFDTVGALSINTTNNSNTIFGAGRTTIPNASSTQLTVSDKSWLGNLLTRGNTISATNDSGLNLFDNADNGITVLDGGNVGIGTTTPSQKLSVTGNTYITGALGVGVATTTAGTIETSGDLKVGGNLNVIGDAIILGEAHTGTLSIESAINSNLIPDQNAIRDLGSPAYYWDDLYTDSLFVNSLSAASTTISGTQSSIFTINSDNSTLDTEDIDLVFFRGTVVPNALISWNSTLDKFDFNQPVFFQNDSSTTTVPSLEVRAKSGQTSDVLKIADSAGASYLNIDSNGKVAIGTTTAQGYNLAVGGSLYADEIYTSGSTFYMNGDPLLSKSTDTLDFGVETSENINFSVNNEPALYINSQKNIGIGNTNPTSLLNITSTSTNSIITKIDSSLGSQLFEFVEDSSGNSLFRQSNYVNTLTNVINTSGNSYFNGGNIGIGTNNPLAKLHINGGTGTLSTGLVFGDGDSGFYEGADDALKLKLADVDKIRFYTTNMDSPFGGGFNILFGAGSSTAPIYRFEDDEDTGLGRADANQLSLITAGSEAVRINASGHVGIGTTSPSQMLHVTGSILQGTDAGAKLYIYDTNRYLDNDGGLLKYYAQDGHHFDYLGGEAMRITNNGNVGIGTTAPGALLHLESDTATFKLGSKTNNGGLNTIEFGHQGQYLISKTAIQSVPTGSWGQSDLYFILDSVGDGLGYSRTTDTKMVIKNNGNVGIGTTAPAKKLHIYETIDSAYDVSSSDTQTLVQIQNPSATASAAAGIQFFAGASNSGQAGIGVIKTADSSGDMYFMVRDSGTRKEAMRIDSIGNVGIGTTAPGAKLHVSGGDILVDNAQFLRFKNNAGTNTAIIGLNSANNLQIGSGAGATGYTAISSGGGIEGMRIDSTGNVGIGTTVPGSKLHISTTDDSITNLLTLAGNRNTENTEVGILFRDRNAVTSGGGEAGRIYTDRRGTGDDFDLVFASGLDNVATDRMRITSTGNVGIGTTTPSSKLEVAGTTSITGGSSPANGLNGLHSYFTSDIGYISATEAATGNRNLDIQGLNINLRANGANVMYLKSDGNVGIGTTAPTNILSLGNDAARKFWVENSATDVVGRSLTVAAGSTILGASVSDVTGGSLVLQAGLGTGTGNSNIHFQTGTTLTTGTTLQTMSTKMSILGNGNVGIGDSSNVSERLYVRGDNSEDSIVWALGIKNAAAPATFTNEFGVGIKLRLGGAGETNKWSGIASVAESGYANLGGLALYTNEAEAMRITNGGNVGIGTTAPAIGYKLDVVGHITSSIDGAIITSGYGQDYIQIREGNPGVVRTNQGMGLEVNGGTRAVTILTTGNVGIGTTAPDYKFHIKSITGADSAKIIKIESPDASATSMPFWGLHHWDTGQFSIGSTYNDGKFLIDTTGNVGIGTTEPGAKLHVKGDATENNAEVRFETNTGDNRMIGVVDSDNTFRIAQGVDLTTTPRFTIDSSGNVGIGTTAPGAKFVVAGDTSLGGDNGQIRIQGSTNSAKKLYLGVDTSASTSYGYIQSTESGVNVRALSLQPSGGNVGIGTTAPGAKLEVYDASTSKLTINSGSDDVFMYMNSGTDGLGTESNYIFFQDNSSTKWYIGKNTVNHFVIYDSIRAGNVIEIQDNADLLLMQNGGNVGIGTTSPGRQLTLFKSSGDSIFQIDSGDSANSTIELMETGGASDQYGFKIRGDGSDNTFKIDSTINGVDTTRMTINRSTGNVGIGTTAPLEKLQVGDLKPALFHDGGNKYLTWNVNYDGGWKYVGDDSAGGFGMDYINDQLLLRIAPQGIAGETASFKSPLVIDSSGEVYMNTGNVGIGTTAPGAKLEVKSIGVSTTPFAVVASDGSRLVDIYESGSGHGTIFVADSTGVSKIQLFAGGDSYFNTTGNVGIGTTAPGAKLDVNGTVWVDSLVSRGSLKVNDNAEMLFGTDNDYSIGFNSSDSTLRFVTGNDVASNVKIAIDNTGNVGIGTTAPGAKLEVAGETKFNGAAWFDYDWTTKSGGLNFGTDGEFEGLSFYDGSGGSAKIFRDGGIFYVGGRSGDSTKGLAIDNSGNVGIGTTAPGYKLDIKSTGSNPNLVIERTDGSVFYIEPQVGQTRLGTLDATDLFFRTNGVDVFTIKTSGNVGIGTTSPDSKLHVAGTSGVTVSGLGATDGVNILGIGEGMNYDEFQLVGNFLGSGTDNSISFKTDLGGGNIMTMTGGGNVGIGTTSPQSLLHLGGTPGALSSGLTFGDGDTGFYESADDTLRINVGGANRFIISSSQIASTAGGESSALLYEVPSDTNPSIVSRNTDTDTGIGSAAADQLSLIAGGSEGQRITKTTAGNNSLQHTLNAQLGQATGDEVAYSLNYTTNKATTGRDTGLLIDMVDTLSPAESNPLRIRVDGNEIFSITDLGILDIKQTIRTIANNTSVIFQNRDFTTADNAIEASTGIFSNTTGSSAALAILPTYNQTSGDGANTDLLINRTETAVGSGVQYLIDAQVGGSRKFSVENSGTIQGNQLRTVNSNSSLLLQSYRDFTVADNAIEMLNTGTFSNTTGTSAALAILPTYNQASGDAANTDLLINRTETAVGSGEQSLIRAQVGGVDKFRVKSDGVIKVGKIEVDNGSATFPSFRFSSDINTGIFQGGADNLAFTTGGSEAMRIGATGNVGIGTTAPGARLLLKQSGTSYTSGLFLEKNTAGINYQMWIGSGNELNFGYYGSPRMVINSDGNVGIGMTSPQSLLHLGGTPGALSSGLTFGDGDSGIFESADDSFKILVGGTERYQISTSWFGSNHSDGARLKGSGATAIIPSVLPTNDTDTGLGSAAADQLSLIAGGTEGIRIASTSATTADVLIMNGNVGIGTSSPGSLLTITNDNWISSTNSNGSGYVNMFKVNSSDEIEVGGNLNIGSLGFAEDGGFVTAMNMPVSSTPTAGDVEAYTFKLDNDSIMTVYSEADGSGGIQNTGVGIGTTTPQGLFAVATSTSASFFVVDRSTGNIGMGINNPSYQLQLSTDSAAKPGTATWTVDSDERLKDVNGDFTRGLSALEGLYPSYFNYKIDNERGIPSDREYVGLIAQDVQKVIPEAVKEGKDGFLSVESDPIFWTMLNAIKELALKVGSDNITYTRDTLQVLNDTGEPQMKLAYDQENLAEFKVSAVGDLSLSTAGKDIRLPDDNMQICSGGACPTNASVIGGTGNLIVENTAYVAGSLGVGTPAPSRIMDVYETQSDPQMRISYDEDLYSEFNVSATGDLTISAAGGDISVLNENLRVCSDDGCPSAVSQIENTGNLVVENSILALGNVGIGGIISPDYTLDVHGTLRAYGITDASDIRLKTNIRSLSISNKETNPQFRLNLNSSSTSDPKFRLNLNSVNLQNLQKLRGVKFEWKDSTFGTGDQIGMIAQEMEKVYPELVSTDNDGYKSIQYAKFTAVLLEAVKDLINWGETIEYRSARLEDRTTQLEQENKTLKQKTQSLESRIEALENILRQ